jgi:hypothetical protein
MSAIAIPDGIAALPVDKRGYPIFWTAHITPDGEPDFRILEMDRVFKALKERRCGMYDRRIEGQSVCFLSTRENADGLRRSTDPPMHEDCLRYALVICPFLSRRQARRSGRPQPSGSDYSTLAQVDRSRPDDSLIVWTRSYDKSWRVDIHGFHFGPPFRTEFIDQEVPRA